jgi:hypothetical protein
VGLINREPKVINLAARPKKKPKAKTRAKRAVKHAATVKCGTCGKRYRNPLTHTCTVKSDFAKRKRAAERQRKRDQAKARRAAAAGRRKAAAADRRAKARGRTAPRPRAPQHDYRTCRDEDCRRTACLAFQEGIEACPLEHSGV